MAFPKKIAVFRTDRIGDLVLSTPVFRELRGAFPEAHIAAVVRSPAADILRGNPHLSEIIQDSQAETVVEMTRKIRNRKFDTAVVLFSDKRIMKIIRRSGVPERIGPLSGVRSYFSYNRGVRQNRSASRKHEAEYNLDLLRPLGIDPRPPVPEIFLSETERTEAHTLLKESGIQGSRYACVHPGMGHSALNWKPEYYARLADRLAEEYSMPVILTGGPADREMIDRVLEHCTRRHIDICGRTGLRQLGAVFEKAVLVAAPSTGPLHMAAALGTPVFSVYSPVRVQSAKRWGPIGENSHVLTPHVSCAGKYRCRKERCADFFCMDAVTPDQVLEAVARHTGGDPSAFRDTTPGTV